MKYIHRLTDCPQVTLKPLSRITPNFIQEPDIYKNQTIPSFILNLYYFYCPHCGMEYYYYYPKYQYRIDQFQFRGPQEAVDRLNGYFSLAQKYYKEQSRDIDIWAASLGNTCPFCKGEIPKTKGYIDNVGEYYPDWEIKIKDNSYMYSYMNEEFEINQNPKGLSVLLNFLDKCVEEDIKSESEGNAWYKCKRLRRLDIKYYHIGDGLDKIAKTKDFDTAIEVMAYLDALEISIRAKRIRATKSANIAKNKATKFVTQSNNSYISSHELQNADHIQQTPAELKRFLSNLVNTEVNIRSLSRKLEDLYMRQILNKEAIVADKQKISLQYEQELQEVENDYKNAIQEYNEQIACYKNEQQRAETLELPRGTNAPVAPLTPVAPILEKPGLFRRKTVEEKNRLATEAYNEACLAYEKAHADYLVALNEYENKQSILKAEMQRNILRDAESNKEKANIRFNEAEATYKLAKDAINKKIEQNNEIIESPNVFLQKMLDEEIKVAEKALCDSIHCRNKYYDSGVIFGKYHDFVAVTMFYEYIYSSRCLSLTGPDGAYNLYESELRANLIISNLTKIMESLEKIKENQYSIYNKLCDIDRGISRLNKSMDEAINALNRLDTRLENIEATSEVIAYNTATTAYYSKINAELTNALGFMVALK